MTADPMRLVLCALSAVIDRRYSSTAYREKPNGVFNALSAVIDRRYR